MEIQLDRDKYMRIHIDRIIDFHVKEFKLK